MYSPLLFPYPEHQSVLAQEDQRWSVVKSGEEVILPGVSCNLTSPGLQIYGHWLVDAMPRLFKCLRSELPIDHYILPTPVKSWQIDLLRATGVDENKILRVDTLGRRVVCEKMMIPTFDRFNSELSQNIISVHREIAARVLKECAPNTEKLFVSRGGWPGMRYLVNRDQIEAKFAQSGFTIVRPETVGFDDQIRLFASAKVIVGECGSGMHNAVYCLPGTRVGIIQSADNHNFLQAQLAMWCKCDISYLIGQPVSRDEHDTSFAIDWPSLDVFIDALTTP